MKTYAFIDSQNLNLGIQSLGWKLDWRKFRQYLRNKYGVVKAYLFIGQVAGNESLYAFLQESGYILIFKPTLYHREKTKTIIKGNDQKVVIVSGDGDFYCLVELLEEKNKLLRVLAPNKHYSGLLHKYNSYIVRVDLLRNSLEKNKTKISDRSKP